MDAGPPVKADVRSGARQRALELSKCIVTCDDLMARRTFPQEWPVKDNAEDPNAQALGPTLPDMAKLQIEVKRCRLILQWRRSQASTFGLIAFFGLYGVVYLSRLTGVLDHYQERVWYLCMNITTKLIMLMLFWWYSLKSVP
ncbi:unnamed protein product [Durusdinium trenchii]|uniref:Uncharacterized protein n=1 Tax=Durusdinium trenchii TaxID=1381693 RepID=A0ABP0N8Q2_9DINO